MAKKKKTTRKKAASVKTKSKGVSYADAGVDLKIYEQSMKRLPAHMHRTFGPRVMRLDGGFAGLFALDSGKGWKKRNYKDPVIVSGTDGVGSKIQIAQKMGVHNTVGIDLVAMCVNDVVCCGAEPLFFLDYVAMSHDDPETLEQIVSGISEGCMQSGSALLGGETAIMPGTYKRGDYDLAGFQVGVVERKKLIDGTKIRAGDVAIGLASTGVHSNGFSLVRKVVFEAAKLKLNKKVDELGGTIGETLLTPTRIYVPVLNEVLQSPKLSGSVHGLAHITGGGMAENIERVLPKELDVIIDGKAWDIPAVFPWIKGLGKVAPAEMYRVFNMGIGMVMLVNGRSVSKIRSIADEHGIANFVIGEVTGGKGKVKINNRRVKS